MVEIGMGENEKFDFSHALGAQGAVQGVLFLGARIDHYRPIALH
jgi:hypothetical protein